jgi:hypothetical protein
MSGKSIARWLLWSLIALPLTSGPGIAKAPEPEPEPPEPEPAPEPEPEPAPEPAPIEIPPFEQLPPLTMPEPPAAPPAWPTLPGIEPVPSTPSVPTEPPRPRAKPPTFKFRALHRYEVVVDVLPVDGVSLQELAEKVIPYMRMTDPDVESRQPVQRNGKPATRLKLTVNTLFQHEEPLDRERSFAGVGSIWIVSARDLGAF